MAEVAGDEKVLVKDGKNSTSLLCQRCSCIILKPNLATFATKEIFLPNMKSKTASATTGDDGETLTDFWLVDNMYTFENVGFSNTIGTIKYLICADCEIGPIGWHDIQDKAAFFVALNRVEHVTGE